MNNSLDDTYLIQLLIHEPSFRELCPRKYSKITHLCIIVVALLMPKVANTDALNILYGVM